MMTGCTIYAFGGTVQGLILLAAIWVAGAIGYWIGKQ